jgi:NADP-dependent 3-hydroxy acid dehydrogenase YdfG
MWHRRNRVHATVAFSGDRGSQGIGAAIVEQARNAGHQVVFTGRNKELIDAVARKTGAVGLLADVSVPDQNARTVDQHWLMPRRAHLLAE